MPDKNTPPIQDIEIGKYLFEQIRLQIPNVKAIPKTIADVLHLTESAVYKKLRGDNPLTLQEAALLATHFHISLDNHILPASGIVPMAYPPMTGPVNHPLDFLRGILHRVEDAVRLPEVQLFYATSEIPLFHYLPFPELTAFKLFVWGRTTWELDRRGLEVHPETLAQDPDLHHICRQMYRYYQQFPSTEFWALHLLDNTVKQLRYFANTHIFRQPDFVDIVLEQIQHLLDEQASVAAAGQKKNGGSFGLFYNEIAHTNNTILLYSPLGSIAFATYDNPNFIFSANTEFCNHTYHWFLRLQKRSIPLSGRPERERAQFFNNLRQRIQL